MRIVNTDGQQATILKEELAGFVFESNRNTRHTFTAETSLAPEISPGWGTRRKLQTKIEMLKLKVQFFSYTVGVPLTMGMSFTVCVFCTVSLFQWVCLVH